MTKLDDQIAQYRKELKRRPRGRRPQEDTGRDKTLFNLAGSLEDRFEEKNDIGDLQGAIGHHRTALTLRPEGHPDRHKSLNDLARCLQKRYRKRGTLPDLEEAITLGRALLDLHPEGHPDRSKSLHSLALYFGDRYDKQASVTDLEEAITLCRAALELRPPGHSDRAPTLYYLGLYLRLRFLKLGATADRDEAILHYRSAWNLSPEGHPNRSDLLYNLALCVSDRYDKQASVTDLREAIMLWRAVLELRPRGHPDRAPTLHYLGFYLRCKFLRLGATADLNEAISHHRSALDLRPPRHRDRLMSLDQLASCLDLRFEKLEAPDLDDLIALDRAILDFHPPGHDDRAKYVDKLLLHLRRRHKNQGTASDLDECITLGRIALGLCKPGDPGRATYYRHLVEDLRSMLRKLESASDVLNSSDHTMFLRNLDICVGGMVSEGHVSTDSDEVVAVARDALRLCPSGYSNHVTSLTALATCLQYRFQQHGNIADLDEAIILCKEVLERCPSGSPDRAPRLHKLAWCLSQRFFKLSTRSDLNDAIKFERAASGLYPPGHPDRVKSFKSLVSYCQLLMKRRGTPPPPDHPGATANLMIEQVVGNIVFDVLKAFPLRLLDAHNGMLCDRDAQMLHFKNSQQYKQLVLSTSALDTSSQTARIREDVSTYFQYVTLSHRWRAFEPLLCDVKEQAIYDLGPNDGLSKLQSFCLATLEHGYFWAWSDTCCIDRENSAELQEAIGSMFLWYRQSALTMVHLADVSGTRPLTSSEWFKRGWTLQELLAPRALLFLTQDWSPYGDISSNHKDVTAILSMLEQATGIMSRHLTSFHPGADDARARLQWASTRCTTRPEDIAYSLFGVFGLNLPVLYGESAEYALGRLLAQVISRSGDTTILDWIGKPSKFHSCFPDSILPYQTPLQLPSLNHTTSPDIQDSHRPVNFVRKMHQALFNLPLAQFVNIKLLLPCIVYRVKIMRTRVHSAATHVHHIQATGLEPIEITLSQPLENISKKPLPYVLIRPWHPNLLDASVMNDDTSACQWLAMMQQPFSALLLKQRQQNEYTRVATSCHILAHPANSNGALKGEVTTLTIV